MSSEEVNHPLFARMYTRLSSFMEQEVGVYRDELLEGLSGRVLEVGAGNGMNFAHYGGDIDEVVALEPEEYMRDRAAEATAGASVPITIVDGLATPLPFEDDSFDAVVFCLVLCSINQPVSALSEARRVLKPGGTLRFFEHVRSRRGGKSRVQDILDNSGIWPKIGGGCHCARDTAASVSEAGFEITEMRGMGVGPGWGHTNPHILGRARRPD